MAQEQGRPLLTAFDGRFTLLRAIVSADIEREGVLASTMLRAGLVQDLLDDRLELLEALKEAEKHFGPFAEITINGEHDPEDLRVVGLMRAAIAKVENRHG